MSKQLNEAVRKYLAQIAKKGGEARAKKYSKEMLSNWAKKGGRPPKESKGGK